MSVRADVDLNGIRVPFVLDDEALAAIAAAGHPPAAEPPSSRYLTIPEAAELLRCRRQRIDDLLSQRRLTRHKDGSRTLIARSEIEAWLARSNVTSR